MVAISPFKHKTLPFLEDTELQDMAKAIHDSVRESLPYSEQDLLDTAKAIHDQVLASIELKLTKHWEARFASLEKMLNLGVHQIHELLKNLPTPEIKNYLPETQIHNHVAAPESPVINNTFVAPETPVTINNHIPKDAIKSEITVHQQPSVVNNHMTVPEGAIEISYKSILEMPKRKTITEKSVVYNPQTGRPDKIIESTTEE